MNDDVAALVKLDGWHGEGAAARVHYEGARERFSVEYYAPAEAVLYWSVPGGEEDSTDGNGTASPIVRTDVPNPLRKRIRRDLESADIDPEVERKQL